MVRWFNTPNNRTAMINIILILLFDVVSLTLLTQTKETFKHTEKAENEVR